VQVYLFMEVFDVVFIKKIKADLFIFMSGMVSMDWKDMFF